MAEINSDVIAQFEAGEFSGPTMGADQKTLGLTNAREALAGVGASFGDGSRGGHSGGNGRPRGGNAIGG